MTAEIDFQQVMRRYVTTLLSYRQLALMAGGLDGSVYRAEIRRPLPRFSDVEKTEALVTALRELLTLLERTMVRSPSGNRGEEGGQQDIAASAAQTTVSEASTPSSDKPWQLTVHHNEPGRPLVGTLTIADRDVQDLFSSTLTEVAYGILSPEPATLVLASLVVTLVSTFDVLAAEVISAHCRAYPAAVSDRPRLSLLDLEPFESVRDARDALIAQEVNKMDWSVDALAKWFRSRAGIELPELALDWSRFSEIVQRRHVIVHAGGRVTPRYIEKVGSSFGGVGAELSIDRQYFEVAIDEFLTIGVALAFALWTKKSDQLAAAAAVMLETAQRMAHFGRWQVVTKQCEVVAGLHIPRETALEFQVLSWLAAKADGGLAAVEADVRAWDVSALEGKWQLARSCLLDELDEAARLLNRLLSAGDLSAIAVMTNVIYDDLRRHEMVRALLAESGVELEDLSVVLSGQPHRRD